jgi:virulence-associated protein VapD
MFAIAFDLVVAEAEESHPKGSLQAYADMARALKGFGFERIQGSVYVTETEDMANLFSALLALRELPWFPASVRDIRAFRIEQWSDFTPLMKAQLKKP